MLSQINHYMYNFLWVYSMKVAIRTIIFHISCIILFSFLYLYFESQFVGNKVSNSYIDFLLLSTTVQAGVGITDLYPVSFYSKLFMIIQQVMMITTHIFTLYIFTL